jgi:hypothetical protein
MYTFTPFVFVVPGKWLSTYCTSKPLALLMNTNCHGRLRVGTTLYWWWFQKTDPLVMLQGIEWDIERGKTTGADLPLLSIFLVLLSTFEYLEQKLLGRLWKSLVFLKSNIYVSENHSVIKKMFHKGPVAANRACQKWHILFLDIFQRNLAHP